MARVPVNPVQADGKRKRGRPSKAAQTVAQKKMIEQVYAQVDTNETDAERVKRIAKAFTVMYKLTQGSIAGNVRGLIVSGAPGTGKSHTIESLLEAAHDRGEIKYATVRGAHVSQIELYKLLWNHKDENQIIFMDDSDGVFQDESTIGLLKIALDTTNKRMLSYMTEAASLKAEGIPPTFEYKGTMIFATNIDFQNVVDFGKNKLVPHVDAILNRALYLDLKLHHPKDLCAWVSHMVTKNHILVQDGLTRAEEAEVVEWAKENYSKFRSFSIRTLKHAATFVKTDYANWKMFAEVILFR
jgi:hypothetical protein